MFKRTDINASEGHSDTADEMLQRNSPRTYLILAVVGAVGGAAIAHFIYGDGVAFALVAGAIFGVGVCVVGEHRMARARRDLRVAKTRAYYAQENAVEAKSDDIPATHATLEVAER